MSFLYDIGHFGVEKLAFMFFSGLYESIGLTFSSKIVTFENCHITLITHPQSHVSGLKFSQ